MGEDDSVVGVAAAIVDIAEVAVDSGVGDDGRGSI